MRCRYSMAGSTEILCSWSERGPNVDPNVPNCAMQGVEGFLDPDDTKFKTTDSVVSLICSSCQIIFVLLLKIIRLAC